MDLVLAADETDSKFREIRKGERLIIKGRGGAGGIFTVDDVSKPDANGTITLAVTEVKPWDPC